MIFHVDKNLVAITSRCSLNSGCLSAKHLHPYMMYISGTKHVYFLHYQSGIGGKKEIAIDV